MQVLSIHLRDFRNYTDRHFSFPGGGAVLCGPNGTGKTNLFEAMAYCAFGRSFRTRSDHELVRHGEGAFRVELQAQWNDVQHGFEAAWAPGEAKRIRLDGARVERIGDLYRWLRLIYLSPGDIGIVNGAAGERRRFFDQAVSQTSFAYVEGYRRYTQVLRQRNALLKARHSPREKQVWDDHFSLAAADVVQRRLAFLDSFTQQASLLYRAISGAREELGIRYVHSLPREEEAPLREQFTRQLARVAEREQRHQRTVVGPHLDDMALLLDGRPARQYASQGQQRSLAIALRLAQAHLVAQQTGEPPVMVFDDVLAELDDGRSRRVMEQLGDDTQVFVARPCCTHVAVHGLPIIDVTQEETR